MNGEHGPVRAAYEVRYSALNGGISLAFPCDANGQVNLDRLTERGRANYLRARTLVGRDYGAPRVFIAGPDEPL